MLALLSPSKDLDYKTPPPISGGQLPRLLSETEKLVSVLRKKNSRDLMKLMDISEKIAIENTNRYQHYSSTFDTTNARPAIFAFSGDVYRGLDARSLNKTQIQYCEKHLRILSGLYGLLRPLDLMQAYRLEMGTSLTVGKSKDLYHFWKAIITDLLRKDLEETKSKHLVNLASQEYIQVLDLAHIPIPMIHVHFREYRNNKLTFVSYNAKRARGLMARYMALSSCKKALDLQGFNLDAYGYAPEISDEWNWYFIR